MKRSPMSLYLNELKGRLSELGIPVFFHLPDSSTPEPFIVINHHNDSDDLTAKTGAAIVDTFLQVDLFTPLDSRVFLEDAIYQVKHKIGRSKNIQSETVIDTTGARDCYHTVFTVNTIII
ncbi:hypothetical protein [Listeria grayi]|uniref:hypothetical protein n=1 Tax=Listeria grayi TaxID=1641 RepID=UPI0016252897|nr:hypothetical protein [Listeria grayi]MBC1921977.1 hypothetical protein [Listeria grayi]